MLVLSGPSASGKTEIIKILMSFYKMERMVTYTTRGKRDGEINGRDYHFVTRDEFMDLIDKDEFIETITYNNNYYGTRKSDVKNFKAVVLDPSGVNSFYKEFRDKICIIYLETRKRLRNQRMIARLDLPSSIKERMNKDDEIFKKSNYHHIDYVIENNEISIKELAAKVYLKYESHLKMYV